MNDAVQAAASPRTFVGGSLWEHIKNDRRTLAFLFLLPTTVVLISVVIYPFFYALLISMQAKIAGAPGTIAFT